MHRLFVAVDPPLQVSEQLHALRDEGLDARWLPAGNHHLTLKFIGNVDAERRDAIAARLGEVSAAAPRITLDEISIFPSWRHPSVLVVLVRSEPTMLRLFEDVERALHGERIDPESKPFRPHITIARVRRARPEAVRQYVQTTQLPAMPTFSPDRFRLYESALKFDGAVYACLAEYPLEVST